MRLCDDGTCVDDWGEPPPRVSFLAPPRTHALGHNQSYDRSGNRYVTGTTMYLHKHHLPNV